MAKFRTNTPDAPEPRTSKLGNIGEVPANKVEVLDHHGRHRGMVGRKATAAVASRFLGGRGVTLTTVNGRQCWKGMQP